MLNAAKLDELVQAWHGQKEASHCKAKHAMAEDDDD